jgi:hypothetical protein
MITGFEPVVLASTVKPASLKQAAISLATLDFPLVPVTQILKGMDRTVFMIDRRSHKKKNTRKTRRLPPKISSLINSLLLQLPALLNTPVNVEEKR